MSVEDPAGRAAPARGGAAILKRGKGRGPRAGVMETWRSPGLSRPLLCLLRPRGGAEGPRAQQGLSAVLPSGARPVSAGAISCHLTVCQAEVPALEADNGQRSQRLRKKSSARSRV